MNRLYNFSEGRLKLEYGGFINFDLSLRSPITVITGESATGKSLLVQAVEVYKEDAVENSNISEEFCNIYAFDKKITIEDLNKVHDALIVIDRADFILNKGLVDFIKEDMRSGKNQYLIFARAPKGFGVSPNHFGEFVMKDNCITIKYRFNEECWS